MSTLDRVTVSDLETAAGPPRRRWGRWVAAAAVVLLVMLIGAGLWVASYQPLTVGSWSGADSNDVIVRDDTNMLGSQSTLVRPRGGDQAVANFSVSLPSDAPFPVTIDDVSLSAWVVGGPMVGYLSEVRTSAQVWPGNSPFQTFTPTTLQPGQELNVKFEMTFADCGHVSPGTRWLESLPVTYTALGMTHTVEVPLVTVLALQDARQCLRG